MAFVLDDKGELIDDILKIRKEAIKKIAKEEEKKKESPK